MEEGEKTGDLPPPESIGSLFNLPNVRVNIEGQNKKLAKRMEARELQEKIASDKRQALETQSQKKMLHAEQQNRTLTMMVAAEREARELQMKRDADQKETLEKQVQKLN